MLDTGLSVWCVSSRLLVPATLGSGLCYNHLCSTDKDTEAGNVTPPTRGDPPTKQWGWQVNLLSDSGTSVLKREGMVQVHRGCV